jgi:hypothetical protein
VSASQLAPLLLSPDELEAVTGYRHAKAQNAWLQMKGWRFEINAVGRPVVARRYAKKMLGCGADDDRVRPNFAALRAA